MISGATALSFVLVCLLGAMAPGPDFLVVTRSAILGGRKAGIAAGLGIALGVFVWVVAIALGVAAILTASAIAFTVVKLIGAAYLVFLGVKAWLAVRRGDYSELKDKVTPVVAPRAAFRHGLLTNLLNPKVAVFFLALLPQFLPHTASTAQTLQLAMLATAVAVVWTFVLATLVGSLRKFFSTGRVRRAMDAVMGTLLVGLGIRVAVQS
ncbi:LysE family translocator [Amycolatopsis regifaucium]|uniref:Lysine transporter LysE n=1 Tax=Amycolatopsis regifaucium TaxID=546365 RepID=A0A154MRW0_9PSEU|nr:LysE family translocator [Amycolatopsis regifaucium]KZB86209.1 lysine transporter LysE [Amycolatopsis regifaucium]OKA05099.1 lysine transporter LysE [Amycolatopsis regifaucium]SFH82001.1 resistance to homoserine/threonine (RhtB) family protein [Amycolatopsis regifaucium]